MSALNARRWRVRGQMVATDDSARRCARVDGVYSAPGVDGVYSTAALEARVAGARRAAIGPLPALQACSPPGQAVRSSVARRRRSFTQRSLSRAYADIQALWVPTAAVESCSGTFFALASCIHTSNQSKTLTSGSHSCVQRAITSAFDSLLVALAPAIRFTHQQSPKPKLTRAKLTRACASSLLCEHWRQQ